MIHIRKQAGFTSALAFSTHTRMHIRTHTHTHSLTQGKEKNYISIIPEGIHAGRPFVPELRDLQGSSSSLQKAGKGSLLLEPSEQKCTLVDGMISPSLVCIIGSTETRSMHIAEKITRQAPKRHVFCGGLLVFLWGKITEAGTAPISPYISY